MDARRSRRHPIRDTSEESAYDQFAAEGSVGYEQGTEQFREEHTDEDVSIKCKRAKLLRLAGLSRKAQNNQRVSDAIERLTRSIGDLPPLLSDCAIGTTLRLTVDHEWIPTKRFGRVALPLLTSGPTPLALSLFLSAADRHGSIRAEELYRRLGIRADCPAHATRDLDGALRRVNDHRRALGLATFKITLRHGDRLSFRAIELAPDGDEDRRHHEREDDAHDGGWGDEEYPDDDDELDERRQELDREYDRQRAARDQDIGMFAEFNARLKSGR